MDLVFNSRRSFFGMLAGIAAVFPGASELIAQQVPHNGGTGADSHHGPASHIHNGVFYFSGIGSNDGYGPDARISVTDSFDRHVTRTMDTLKKTVEHAGSNMDSITNLHVFICLPNADNVQHPIGKARFDAYQTEYETLNKIYRTYFSPGKAPARCCMAVDWIPGNSLIEVVGSAMVLK